MVTFQLLFQSGRAKDLSALLYKSCQKHKFLLLFAGRRLLVAQFITILKS